MAVGDKVSCEKEREGDGEQTMWCIPRLIHRTRSSWSRESESKNLSKSIAAFFCSRQQYSLSSDEEKRTGSTR